MGVVSPTYPGRDMTSRPDTHFRTELQMLLPSRRPRACALTALLFLLAAIPASASAAPSSPAITLDKQAAPRVLYGTDASVTLKAANPLGEPYGYNLTFRDVLPAGISYVAGSTPFAPTVIADQPAPGQTTLIWANIADLSPGSDYSFTYKVHHDPSAYTVGDTYTNNAGAYINTDPRVVPKFDAAGLPIAASATGSATDSATTLITAVKIDKSEPRPEGELLRGVHDHQTTYTLTVTNNQIDPTDAVVVDDYLPAGLEFLQCGGIDHTTDAPTNPGSPDEYPGSGSLDVSAPLPSAQCPDPTLVDTVDVDPDGAGPLPAGIYTHVRWNLADLAPGGVQTIRYRAAIPIRENTLDWNGAADDLGTAPDPICTAGGACLQAANLDNNSGPETFDEQALTNVASVHGQFNGVQPAADQTTLTRTAEDLAVQKSVVPAAIAEGEISTWTLQIEASEYRHVQDIHVTDTIPNGLCPVGRALLTGDVNHEGPPQSAECDPTNDQPSSDYTSVTENADGTYTATWDQTTDPALADLPANGTTTITFPTVTRAHYQSNFTDAAPVLNYDSWTNHVSIAGPAFIVSGTDSRLIDHDRADGELVSDVSEASQTAPGPSIDKQVSDVGVNPVSCAGTYIDTVASSFGPGDIVCWQLTVTFATGVHASAARVADFLPTGSDYVPGSAAVTGANTAPIAGLDSSSPGYLLWTLGDAGGYVQPGATFQVRFASKLTGAQDASGDIKGNLMKFSDANTARKTFPLRDLANFEVTKPVLALAKGVLKVNGTAVPGGPKDGVTVNGGDVVTFEADVRNTGDRAASGADVWDVLPPQLGCADVGAISDGGLCAAGKIRWTGLGAIAVGATTKLTYDVTVPNTVAPGETLTNTAAVTRYTSATNDAGAPLFTYVPANPTVNDPTAGTPNAPAAEDPSNISTPSSLTKTRTTSVTGQPGNGVGQAAIGERVDYTVSVTLPRNTTIGGSATVTDPIPAGLAYVASSAAAKLDATALPTAGLTLGFNPAGTGTVTVQFPATYVNNTASDQVLTITFGAVVADSYPQNRRGGTITNTATGIYRDSQNVQHTLTGSVGTTVVEPNLKLAKTDDDPDNVVNPGQTVRYTLTTTNPSGVGGVSSAYDTQLVDTLPVGLVPLKSTSPNVPAADGDTVTPDGGVWNAALRTISWSPGTVDPNASVVRRYDVEVDGQRVAGQQLDNSAQVTGTSMAGGVPGERGPATSAPGYKAGASDQLTLLGLPALGKSVSPAVLTPGGDATYTLDVTIPGGLRYYDLTILDQMPDGLRYTGFVGASCLSGCPPAGNVSGQVAGIPATQDAAGDTALGFFLGDIAPAPVGDDRVIRIHYTAHLDDSYVSPVTPVTAGDDLTNHAGVLWNQTDKIGSTPTSVPSAGSFDTSGPTASAHVKVVEPHLTLDKQVSGDPGGTDARQAQPGTVLTYKIVVSNASANASNAYDVRVTDLPDSELTGVTLAAGAPSTDDNVDPWSAADPAMTWVIPVIGPNQSVTLTYTATVKPGSALHDGDVATNTAGVSEYFNFPGPVRPPDHRRYTDVAPDTVDVTIDLPSVGLVKTTGAPGDPDNASGLVGRPFHWRVVVTNTASTATAAGVDVRDTLPAGWVYDAGSAQLDGSPVGDPAITGGGTVLTWTDLTDLAAGAGATLTFDATPTTAALDPGQLPTNPYTNTATSTFSDASGSTGSLAGPYSSNSDTATATLQVPSLSIVKTPDAGAKTAGRPFDWTIVVTNTGDAVADNVVIRDVLPAGVAYTPNDASFAYAPAAPVPTLTRVDESTSVSDHQLSWKLSALAVGQKATITVPVTPDSGLPNATKLTNTAYTSADQQPLEVSDTGDVTVTRSAAITIAKTAHIPTVTAGTNAVFDLVVGNTGPSDAGNVVVTDTLPAGLIAAGATVTPGSPTCTLAAGVLTCHLGTIKPGDAPVTITLTAKVDPSRTDPITNTASVTADDSPPATDDATVTADRQANVSVEKQVTPGSILQGHQATYTIKVHNTGPSDATSVTLADPIPAGLSVVSISPGAPTCGQSLQEVDCAFGTLPPGSAGDRTVTVVVRGDRPGATTNTATVATATPGDDPGDDSASADLTVQPVADLAVVKSAPANVTAGGTFTYTLHVTNNGPATATGVTLTDPIPAGLEPIVARGPQGACSITGQALSCALGTLNAGEARDVEVDVRATFAVAGQTVSNTATVKGNEADEQPANDTSTAPTTVGAAADLVIEKTGPASAPAGGTILYALAVTNRGPQDATGVTVTDTLPAGATVISATPTQGQACTVAGQSVSCALGGLQAGASAQVVLIVKLAAGASASLVNSAAVGGEQPDPDPSNNTDAVTTTIDPGAGVGDVSIAKTLDPGQTIEPGKPVSFTIAVRNDAATPATGVTVVDTPSLPVTVVSVTPSQGTCTTTLPITCALGTIAPGKTVTIRTVLIPLAAGDLRNTATVVGNGGDRRPEDNTASAGGPASSSATALRLRKTSDVTKVTAGGAVWFTLRVANIGRHTATGLQVCDTPPRDTAFVSLRGGTLRSGRACFRIAVLKTGDSASFRVKLRIAPGTTAKVLRNVAVLSADNARTRRAARSVLVVHRRAPRPAFTG